jgi:hypothetical protein
VHAGHYDNGLRIDAEVDTVWKPMNQRSPRAAMYDRITLRIREDLFERNFRGRKELMAKASTLLFVPKKSVLKICRRRRANYKLHQA